MVTRPFTSGPRIRHAHGVARVIRYDLLRPASDAASKAAKGASRKRDTRPELLLRRALWRAGLRGYRVDGRDLPGRPDIVFRRARVAIFCDGDFWHGRELEERVARLQHGHNAVYWVPKIKGNVARDRRNDDVLTAGDWRVMRFWESAIIRDVDAVVAQIRDALTARRASG